MFLTWNNGKNKTFTGKKYKTFTSNWNDSLHLDLENPDRACSWWLEIRGGVYHLDLLGGGSIRRFRAAPHQLSVVEAARRMHVSVRAWTHGSVRGLGVPGTEEEPEQQERAGGHEAVLWTAGAPQRWVYLKRKVRCFHRTATSFQTILLQ